MFKEYFGGVSKISYPFPICYDQKGQIDMEKARILVFGAHLDDSEAVLPFGLCWDMLSRVSVTNGDTGHHITGGGPLARCRQAEAKAAAKVAGIEFSLR
jgi:hypothetical protein